MPPAEILLMNLQWLDISDGQEYYSGWFYGVGEKSSVSE